jgi:hypothetical protein
MKKYSAKEISFLLQYAKEETISVNTSDMFDEDNNEIILESNENTEEQIIKNDLITRLSNEAKTVIETIINCPLEFFQYGESKKRGLKRFLKNKFGKNYKKILNELERCNFELQS